MPCPAACWAIPTSSPRWRRSSIPAVHHERTRFIVQNGDAPALLFDIPLLFETGGEAAFDKVIVVSAPPDVQRARVLARPGMDDAKLDAILARQMPDAEKRKRADFVIETGGDLSDNRKAGRSHSVLSRPRARWIGDPCGKSSSIPKPRGSIRPAATEWSKSAASRFSTGSKPAATSTLISIPSGRCRAKPKRSTG